MMKYEGGYYLLNEPLVRSGGANKHTGSDLTRMGEYTIRAVNLLQETAWEINPFIHDVLKEARRLGGDLRYEDDGDLVTVLRLNMPINPRNNPFEPAMKRLPAEEWQALTKEERKEVIARQAMCLQDYDEAVGEARSHHRIIASADMMREHDKFYFPHNLCFRTRVYPIPTDLNNQSCDLSKALLRFATPYHYGEQGIFWLGVMVATHWGKDKLSPTHRHAYAKQDEFMAKCARWVDDPLGEDREWLKADKPFQFLAAAYEWVWAHRSGNPEAWIGHLPGNLDGSCNGAQHLSIMARDLVGATATNCRKGLPRQDLYMEVAKRVFAIIEEDAKSEDLNKRLLAEKWLKKCNTDSKRRNTVKRAVMTVPYGVTDYGVTEFMFSDKHVDGMGTKGEKWSAAKYMRTLIMSAIDSTLAKGRKLQEYFKECAIAVAEAGKPLVWDTPAGSKVTQAYRNLIEKRIHAYDTKFTVYVEPEEGEDDEGFTSRVGMDVKRMGTAAPPNVVHSCDASALQITVCRMADAGIRDFSMIHDSYGCPMPYVGLMRDILRKTHVDMYSLNYLKTWKESVERYTGVELPEPPEQGDFDITEILESEFFFS